MRTLAAIVDANADLAEILFLVALIIFIVGGVVSITRHAIEMALLFSGLASMALAWLCL